MFFVETISFDIQITHDFMAFNGHSFFYHINILLLIDVVDNRNKTKPRKFWVYRDVAIIDINSKTTKIFDGILFRWKRWKSQVNTILIRYSCISLLLAWCIIKTS